MSTKMHIRIQNGVASTHTHTQTPWQKIELAFSRLEMEEGQLTESIEDTQPTPGPNAVSTAPFS
ncbi:uncharacterized protein ACLA_018200 [Aspergillus clavatus NRRL 1]|uniref:Uncharacterized protein n=1 Tax=Aspergillus clavatus (strain ATCC 1007 / CBS 513.65 / DSM 816 / NCTC 3887 / NRRL 1 / QM 1276 / 107) TaxID=344612 RepID=A1CN95_ASPCL|nr:uncharacterized protein ACLA_018200 [Aspergillus clavatus NRRL 1]EAW07116.1 hypothetical protein ACLA_018200 [Aspergillus clavatus NRRL 1]